MKIFKLTLVLPIVLATMALGTSATIDNTLLAAPAAFQFPSNNDVRARVSDRQLQQILTRLRSDAQSLRRSLGGASVNYGDDLAYTVDDLIQASDHLADHVARRQVIRTDVDDVLRRGAEIGDQLQPRRSDQAARFWTALQRDLDSLASAYGMSSDWRTPQYAPVESRSDFYRQFSGTFELDRARSDDPRRAANQALGQLSPGERNRISSRIADRLEAPNQIAIERNNDEISIASSRAPRMTFDADGRPHSERGIGGRNMTTRATLYGDRLEVTTTGDADTDFSATFEPLENGRSLRVTRRLLTTTLRQPVVVNSVYRRTSSTAQWDIYDSWNAGEGGRWSNDDVVPSETTLIATLDQAVDVRTARENDRITVTVRNAPTTDLEGAVIEGSITNVPSSTDNRGLSMDFDRIRLPNGRTSSFSGTVESVRGPNGEPIPFNGEEVTPRASNQRDEAIQRGAIGAAVGAVIGAVAGGAKGAAIGAVLGGGGAAATVLIGDENRRDLPRGTEFTIRTR